MAKATRTDNDRDASAPRSDSRNGKADPDRCDRAGGDANPPPRGTGRRLGGPRAAALAQQQVEELIRRPVEGLSGLARQRDGWAVMLEVVELERVPPTTDILATYRVHLDDEGELMGYERVHRYYRNQAGGDG